MIFLLLLIGLQLPTTQTVSLIRNQPVWPAHFAAGENGAFYVLDGQDHRITLFDANLQEVKSFGARGPGPGEFFLPEDIFFYDGKLYVQDDGFFTVFTADGQALEKIKKPFRGQWYATGKSWIARKRAMESGQDDLIWFSLDFKESKVLHQDIDQQIDGQNLYLGKRTRLPAISKDHRWLAKPEKDRYLIHIFDTHSGEERTAVKGEVTPLPYTPARVEAATKTALERLAMLRPDINPATLKVHHPPFFAPITRVLFTSDNRLHVYEPLAPGQTKSTHSVNLDGERGPTVPSPETEHFKVLLIDDTHVLVATYEDEEAGIARVKKADLPELLRHLD